MIIKGIQFSVFCRLFMDVVEQVAGISFDDDGLVSVLLSNKFKWKVVRNMIGGVNLYYSEENEKTWHWIGELDADEYLGITIC